MKVKKILLTFLLSFVLAFSAFAAYCSCSTQMALTDGYAVYGYADVTWHYMTSGDCSGPAYNFGSADIYYGGEMVGYIYMDSGFSNPCSGSI